MVYTQTLLCNLHTPHTKEVFFGEEQALKGPPTSQRKADRPSLQVGASMLPQAWGACGQARI